jgi:hypothetical protein
MSGNICAFPGCQLPMVESAGIVTGEVCHIRARNEGGPRFDMAQTESERHDFDNLVLLCRRHHKVVDAQPDVYSAEALQSIKSMHEKTMGRPEQATDSFYAKILIGDRPPIQVNENSGNVVIDSPGAILVQTLNVKATRTPLTLKINAPLGTIGADQEASRYVQHLITRYNDFASADKTRKMKFSYGAISKNIETKFKAAWRLLSMEDFGAVCTYLQQRIDRTRIAKSNAAKGYRSFSSFEEFSADGH